MLHLLDATLPEDYFPDPTTAEKDPNGLLAIGGNLSPTRLLQAYSKGIFPWYNPGEPVAWWSPDPRMVLFPAQLKISRSMRKTLRRKRFQVSMDQAFSQVIHACSAPRADQPDTWLSTEMIRAYTRLHKLGYAHSVESWAEGELVGGLYGVALGGAFFGESMFSTESDASKTAFIHLVQRLAAAGFTLIDCQVYTPHLESLGAVLIPRSDFLRLLVSAVAAESGLKCWSHAPQETSS